MLMQTKSISDRSLLLAVGFFAPDPAAGSRPDITRIATFCGVSERTVRHWLKNGMPKRARAHFENLLAGDYLPDNWRKHGLSVAADRVYLAAGYSVPLDVIRYWPMLCKAVDWSKAVIPRP